MYSVRGVLKLLARNYRPLTQTQHAKHTKHTLPELPYGYDALEPIICKEIMELHHKKHHQTYVNNLNNAQQQLQEAVANNDVNKIVSLQSALKFNGGGHINHTIFWKNLSPHSSKPEGELNELIKQSFGSVDCLKDKMAAAANGIQGSGWAWLGYNPTTGCLQIMTTANQDPLYGTTGVYPLLGIDVWEHAYYLQYLNARAEYTKAIFEIINWDDVRQRYLDSKCGIVK